MSPDPVESLIAQFSGFLVERDFTRDEWQVVAAEFGVGDKAESIDRFYRSWNWGDHDRQSTAIKFLKSVRKEDKQLALDLMQRVYSKVGGAEGEELQQFPALEALESGDTDDISTGLPYLPVRTERFLDIDNIPGQFYPVLVENINKSYRLGIYDGTLVLTRKLLESLLIDILRKQYGTDEIELYYNPDEALFQQFNDLIDNFDDNIADFKHLCGSLDDEFIDELDTFRQSANAEAHSIETNLSEDDIDQYRNQARHTARVLFRIYDNMWITATRSTLRTRAARKPASQSDNSY
jgi:hypothetical protein